jgi:hypothetical protein
MLSDTVIIAILPSRTAASQAILIETTARRPKLLNISRNSCWERLTGTAAHSVKVPRAPSPARAAKQLRAHAASCSMSCYSGPRVHCSVCAS